MQKRKTNTCKIKKEYPFLKETDSLALANAQRNLERAFRNYFQKRAGFPKLKTKRIFGNRIRQTINNIRSIWSMIS